MSTNMPEQSAAKHARFVPGFHYFGGILTIYYFVWSLMRLIRLRTADDVMHFMVGAILMVLFWYARAFALSVQDRVIRLEERLRFARLLPADLQPRIEEFTHKQLIALRFASDAEVPSLARRVLDEDIHDAKAIKAAITEWRADHLRA